MNLHRLSFTTFNTWKVQSLSPVLERRKLGTDIKQYRLTFPRKVAADLEIECWFCSAQLSASAAISPAFQCTHLYLYFKAVMFKTISTVKDQSLFSCVCNNNVMHTYMIQWNGSSVVNWSTVTVSQTIFTCYCQTLFYTSLQVKIPQHKSRVFNTKHKQKWLCAKHLPQSLILLEWQREQPSV